MTTLTNRITTAARAVELAPAVKGAFTVALAAPFYGLGWLAGQLVNAVVWLAAAAVVGYRDATAPRTSNAEGQG